jgi:NADH-quinone oxidoreductase subunit H
MSVLNVLFFFGGWFPLFFTEWFYFIPSNLWITIKILMFMLLFIIVRGTYPRYRYDQLMRLGWKVYLPISLAFILILACWLYTFAYINI